MSLFVASLNSGSNGNCYYVGNSDEAVLIDGGIACREIEKRLKRLGLSIRKIKGVFVSHEHGDHVHGIPSLAKKHNIPVYITKATFDNANLTLSIDRTRTLASKDQMQIGGLTVKAFPKLHDAADPISFVISSDTVNVGVFTDIGFACEHVINHFSQCHAAFLESNYDETMLEQGRYPFALKNRIRGGRGHLSNKQALQLFTKYRPGFMSHLFLVHLSKNNNHPRIVKETFYPVAGQTQIIVASREKETPLFHIRHVDNVIGKKVAAPERFAEQLSIF